MTSSLKQGLRAWRRSPVLAWTAASILAVGIAANSVVFSAVDPILLRPLPFRAPDRLFHLFQIDSQRGIDYLRFPLPVFAELREEAAGFVELAAYDYGERNLAGDGEPERIQVARVSRGLFETLGVAPRLGAGLGSAEEGPEDLRLVVLSDGLWHRRFAGDASVVGRTVRLDDLPYTVAGVMAPGINFPFPGAQAWTPLPMDLERYGADKPWFQVLGRRLPGVGEAEARERLGGVHERVHRSVVGTSPAPGLNVVPLRRALTFYYDTVRLTGVLLMAAVALGLLIACTNVASLLLARGAAREAEMAVRTVLGASRSRLLRQALAESLLLACAGGALGLGLARWGIGLLAAVIPRELYRVGEIALDGRLVAYTTAVSLLTVVAFGLAPALQLSRSGTGRALQEGGRQAGETARGGRLRRVFVVLQIALACALLAGAVVVFRSLESLRGTSPGLDPEPVLALQLTLPGAKYGETARALGFFDEVVGRVTALPEVRSAAFVFPLPLDFEVRLEELRIEGRQPATPGERLFAAKTLATPGYFETVGIPLLSGRDFTSADDAEARPAVIVSQTFAESYWPGEDPLGRGLRLGPATAAAEPATIVGVVGDVTSRGLEEGTRPHVYRPWSQEPVLGGHLVVRGAEDRPRALAPQVRQAIWAVDPNLPISGVRPLEEVAEGALLPWSVSARLFAVLALGALSLAAAGLYGLIAHLVVERRREIAIRLALGADAGRVLRLFLLQGARLAAFGLALGTLLGLGLTRLAGSLLHGVSAVDPLALVGVPAFLAAVVLAATYLPARKAVRLEPRSNLT